MQVEQLANTVSQLQSARSGNLPLQTIPNSKGNASVVSLRSGRELPEQAVSQQKPRPSDAESELEADSRGPSQARSVPLPFPTQTRQENLKPMRTC
ncbi:hypothetical protein CR513_56635, partial [Mucuna pruriens]